MPLLDVLGCCWLGRKCCYCSEGCKRTWFSFGLKVFSGMAFPVELEMNCAGSNIHCAFSASVDIQEACSHKPCIVSLASLSWRWVRAFLDVFWLMFSLHAFRSTKGRAEKKLRMSPGCKCLCRRGWRRACTNGLPSLVIDGTCLLGGQKLFSFEILFCWFCFCSPFVQSTHFMEVELNADTTSLFVMFADVLMCLGDVTVVQIALTDLTNAIAHRSKVVPLQCSLVALNGVHFLYSWSVRKSYQERRKRCLPMLSCFLGWPFSFESSSLE